MRIDLENGKYTYVFDKGHQYALRHGTTWRDLTGDKFVYCLASELEEAREKLHAMAAHNELLTSLIMSSDKADAPHTMSALNADHETLLAFRDTQTKARLLREIADGLAPGGLHDQLHQTAKKLIDEAYREAM